jgi:hypothetical protein
MGRASPIRRGPLLWLIAQLHTIDQTSGHGSREVFKAFIRVGRIIRLQIRYLEARSFSVHVFSSNDVSDYVCGAKLHLAATITRLPYYDPIICVCGAQTEAGQNGRQK